MKPKWVIEDFEPDNKFDELAKEVRAHGMECEVIKYFPMESGSYDVFPGEQCVLFQGSLQLAKQLHREKQWVPGVWLDKKNYDCSVYYAHYGKYLFNDEYIMMPVGEIMRRKDYIFEAYGKENSVFIRPNSGFKSFTGQVFNYETFDKDFWLIKDFSEPDDIAVISNPKNVLNEWRFIVSGKEVITGSYYKKGGKKDYSSDYPIQAEDKVKEILREIEWRPDPMFVIDICQAADNNFYLMEINSFSCAGLYGCDMQKIVETASELAVKEWQELNK